MLMLNIHDKGLSLKYCTIIYIHLWPDKTLFFSQKKMLWKVLYKSTCILYKHTQDLQVLIVEEHQPICVTPLLISLKANVTHIEGHD